MKFTYNNFLPVRLRNAIIFSQSMPFTYNDVTMNSSDMAVLLYISNNKDISSSEIAEKMDCTKSFISQVVSRLEKKGYIYRKQLEERKRFFGLYLTEKGYEITQACSEFITANNTIILNSVMEKCNEEELETFLKVGDIIGRQMLEHMYKILAE